MPPLLMRRADACRCHRQRVDAAGRYQAAL